MSKIVHESAKFHVTGEATYIDDIQTNNQTLFGYVYKSPYAYAKLKSFDFTEAKKVKGVHAVLSHKDIKGINNVGPIIHDEEALPSEYVKFKGQVVFLIAAENQKAALEAMSKIKVEFEELTPVLTIEEAIAKNELLHPERKIERGNIDEGFKKSAHIIEGELQTGSQEHWYLETQVALAIPNEGDDIKILSSTQNPMETQLLVAEVLGINVNEVEVETRRMGGAFGGKEAMANHVAAWAAILAKHTKRPVKLRLERDEDQIITGKRHPFLIKYKAGFDNSGKIQTYYVELNANAGCSTDLTMAILERAMLHAENSYYIPNVKIKGFARKTNTVSNTAFRGFGGPQGMAAIETAMDKIARKLQIDASEIRFRNFYGIDENNLTPYGQKVENNKLYTIWQQIEKSSDYKKRRTDVNNFNTQNKYFKKGLAVTPVKFGISFTSSFLNQAGALVNIYMDGTVLVNHGGTEMGQGLNTKMKQVAAVEFGISPENVKVNATNTSKVPNSSPTAASSGTDMNGMAVKIACAKIKTRIAEVVANEFNKNDKSKTSIKENLIFENNLIIDSKNPERKIEFKKAVPIVRFNRESLSSTGFYKTPGVNFDRASGTGEPFFYFAFGMSVNEVLVDVLTGHTQLLRTDILHDVGKSINESIDLGQIEGGFVQGLGWVTSEECKWDAKGTLLNHSPDTYKIPGIQDIPKDFRVKLLENEPNPNTIHQSKAVGEPPFMHGLSVWLSIKDAVSAVADHKKEPEFHIPATNENILLWIEDLKK